jgi:beta-fructofuranosidase
MNGSDELMYVLLVSTTSGAQLGGNLAQYFPGSFNGTHFEPVDGAVRFANFGKDFMAPQFLYGTADGVKPVGLGWASDWMYAEATPTGSLNWRGTMSAPLVFNLANATGQGYDLMVTSHDLTSYETQFLAAATSLGNSILLEDYYTLKSNAVYLEVNVTRLPLIGLTGSINITFASSLTGETLRMGWFLGGSNPFWVDCGSLEGFKNPFFSDKFSTLLSPSEGNWRAAILLDRSILEIFLGAGVKVGTASYFPLSSLDEVTIKALDTPDSCVIRVTAYGISGSV